MEFLFFISNFKSLEDSLRRPLLPHTPKWFTAPSPKSRLPPFRLIVRVCPDVPLSPPSCDMLWSCDILTMLWQHDENVMLERSAATGLTVSLESCVRAFPPQHNGGPPRFMGFLPGDRFFCGTGAESPAIL